MRRLLRFAAWLVLSLSVAASPALAGTVLATVPIGRTDLPWWRARFEAKQVELRERHPTLVFYGDSITQDWEHHGPPEWDDFAPIWQRFYGDRNAVNLGFTGDTTASLIWRITHGEADGISPKVAVVLIGANNFGRTHWPADETVQGIDTVVRLLRQRLPRTKILLLGVLPSDRSAWITEQTAAANRLLARRYAHGDDVTFLDVGHVLLRNGAVNRDLYLDPKLPKPSVPLHPNAQGQALLAAAMEPTLAALLGDRVHQ